MMACCSKSAVHIQTVRNMDGTGQKSQDRVEFRISVKNLVLDRVWYMNVSIPCSIGARNIAELIVNRFLDDTFLQIWHDIDSQVRFVWAQNKGQIGTQLPQKRILTLLSTKVFRYGIETGDPKFQVLLKSWSIMQIVIDYLQRYNFVKVSIQGCWEILSY